jgi:hypothetical protein
MTVGALSYEYSHNLVKIEGTQIKMKSKLPFGKTRDSLLHADSDQL